MLNRIVDLTLLHRWFVMLGVLILIGLGTYAAYTIPVEAFPDLTNNQVPVVTEAPSMPPEEVEQLVSYPIEQAMMGLPKQQEVRPLSKFGLSIVTIVFDDSVAFYFARQLVNERLQQVTAQLPDGVQPILGLPATAFGELYQYTLSGPVSAMALREIQEWQIRRQLRMVPGVSEVNTWGGEVRQYQISIDPATLVQYGLTLHDVHQRIVENSRNFGGGFIEHNDEQYILRGIGRAQTVSDLGNILVLSKMGTPVYLRDIADISIGPMPKHGAVLRNGETVAGMVIMLKGENGKRLIDGIKAKIAGLHLPPGVRINSFYDQSTVIDGTIRTVRTNMFEGFALVTVILFLFLGNLRAALITASTIPLSMLISFMNMRAFGVSANLMSLGAIDFGMIVDGAVVMMENSVHHLQRQENETPLQAIHRATLEVARPMMFGVGIIIAVYIPILFLEGLEGRMFHPMAFTVCSALFGALLLALVAVPAFSAFAFRRGIEAAARERAQRHWTRRIVAPYTLALRSCIRHRLLVVSCAVILVGTAIGSLLFIGTEFMPRLDEGSILIETRKLPGISLTDSIQISQRIENTLRAFPEVADIVVKIGRPDFATEAMGINEGDTYVLLRPMERWTRFHSKDQLIEAFDKELGKIPGLDYDFTQPMAMRVDETVSGVKADLAIKIFGDDFNALDSLAQKVLRAVSSVRGAAEPQIMLTSGVAELSVRPDREGLARYGLNVTDVEEAVEAGASGSAVSEVIDGQKRYTVALRLTDRYRSNPEAMRNIMLHAPNGEHVTLGQVAGIEVTRAAEKIEREAGQRRMVVMSNVRGRDLGSFVSEVRARIGQQVTLPAGYFIAYGGQFENQQRATRRLSLIIPMVVAVIFLLLYLTFHSLKQALLVIGNIPFALVGGIAALWVRGMNLNLSALIGFIALFGVAMLNGVVLVSSINQLRRPGVRAYDAVVNGARRRLRPVLMTACVASFGFLPMAISTSTGAEVQRPLASVVIGGLVTSTALTLFLLPVLFHWVFEAAISSPSSTVSVEPVHADV